MFVKGAREGKKKIAGVFRDKKTSHLFAGKLSWRASQKANVVFTVIGDPSTHDAVKTDFARASGLENPDIILGRLEEGGVSLSLQTDYLPKQNVLLRGTIAHVTRSDKLEAATERGRSEPFFIDAETGILSGGLGGFEDIQNARTEIQSSGTLDSWAK